MFVTRTSPQDTYLWTSPSHAGHGTPDPEGGGRSGRDANGDGWAAVIDTSV